jgi:hypothetical protein
MSIDENQQNQFDRGRSRQQNNSVYNFVRGYLIIRYIDSFSWKCQHFQIEYKDMRSNSSSLLLHIKIVFNVNIMKIYMLKKECPR